MGQVIRTSISLSAWPELDQRLWYSATTKGEFLAPDGKAAHWVPETKRQVEKGYGKWVYYLTLVSALPSEESVSPFDRVTKDRLRAYVDLLTNQGLASQTIASRLTDLCEALRVMCPSCDLTVIKHLVSVLNMRATPSRNKAARIKHPFEIWGAACKAMDDAHTTDELTPLHRSCAYRDALALGLLALRPIRLKNLTQLTLSEQLRFDGSQWQCSFSGYETKDKQPLHFALPTDVTFVTCFERYLTEHRPVLLRDPHDEKVGILPSQLTGPLWISTRRTRMSQQSLYCNICQLSERLLGVRLNPHLMRDCAASAMSSDAPEYILAAARILGHNTLSTTIGHYEQSSMLAAGARLNDFILEMQAAGNSGDRTKDFFDLPFQPLFEDNEENEG